MDKRVSCRRKGSALRDFLGGAGVVVLAKKESMGSFIRERRMKRQEQRLFTEVNEGLRQLYLFYLF
jgi:hypothetical protein